MAVLNPLTGQPLTAWQTIVTGPASTLGPRPGGGSGPRLTVVDMREGATLPPWIVRIEIPAGDGVYVTAFQDNGAPGGSYQPTAQQLPDLETTVPPPTWWAAGLLVALLAAGIAWARRN